MKKTHQPQAQSQQLPLGTAMIMHGCCLELLRSLPEESVQCCVTSIPYWKARKYPIPPSIWGDGWVGVMGDEDTIEQYVLHVVEVFQEIKRVLRKDGVAWLNVGDQYAQGGKRATDAELAADKVRVAKKGYATGAFSGSQGWDRAVGTASKSMPAGNLTLAPERLAIALQESGWNLRSRVIWCLAEKTEIMVRSKKRKLFKETVRALTQHYKPENLEFWTGDKWTKVLGWSKSERSEGLKITLRNGEIFNCSCGHLWPTGSGQLKTASDLTVGDSLVRCLLPDQIQPKNIPTEIGWFIGLYLAEGSRSEKTIQFSSHPKEIERLERLEKISESYFGTCNAYVTSESGMTINISSPILNSFIDFFVSGNTSKGKHLSSACWNMGNEFLNNLLFGYLSGDGHQTKTESRWKLGFTRNKKLESDLRTLSSRLDFHIVLRDRTVKISGSPREYLAIKGEIRLSRSGHPNEKDPFEIVSIEKSMATCYWDFGIECSESLFSLSSGILTHNSKPNGLPQSAPDRPSPDHEHIWFITKNRRYFYNREAVRFSWKATEEGDYEAYLKTIWEITTQPNASGHSSTFPDELVRRCILLTTPDKCCSNCGKPYQPEIIEGELSEEAKARAMKRCGGDKNGEYHGQEQKDYLGQKAQEPSKTKRRMLKRLVNKVVSEWRKDCRCDTTESRPAIVLDPFLGSGTTAHVGVKEGREVWGMELGEDFVKSSEEVALMTEAGMSRLEINRVLKADRKAAKES